jgi:hypothetical protein
MKLTVPLLLLAWAAAAPAHAQDKSSPDKPLCVDATRSSNYNARPISLHEVLARNAMGDMRGVRLTTTCIHIDRAATVGLHSLTGCVRLGDTVAVAVPGGPSEVCKVTGVSRVAEDYAGAQYRY